ncbi:hypothetical protein EXIGLDRAFT_411923 [Exidia glandulosa HHB12029]|uniref:Uncharacterized protein n=1 Tax=Exidia glandulosa HHB12029 TaxID=1314781 RepID=A0A165KPY9_EXIGL|nr:hypothetical protein EXIGLDRAFT_411923 [Exidia glandulosa HHB12029]
MSPALHLLAPAMPIFRLCDVYLSRLTGVYLATLSASRSILHLYTNPRVAQVRVQDDKRHSRVLDPRHPVQSSAFIVSDDVLHNLHRCAPRMTTWLATRVWPITAVHGAIVRSA